MKHLFYTNCLVCGREISAKEYLCATCKEKLDNERLSSFTSRCPVCHYPRLSSEYICKNCSKENSIPIYSLMDYSGTYSKAVIEKFKFSSDKNFAPLIASYITECIEALEKDKKAIIVPVPCSASSLEKRGWDQMLLVSKYIKRRCIKAVLNISDSEVQQKTLDKEDREKQAKDKYSINPELTEEEKNCLKTNKIVVIDDICTTGATLRAAAQTLKSNGFTDVCAATWLCEM